MHSQHPEPPVAEQGLPCVYRMEERTRHAVNLLLVALAGLFLFLNVLPLAQGGSLGGLVLVDLAMAALLVWVGSSTNKRVILHRDAIEVAGWFYSRKLSFAEIRGRQTTANARLPGYAYIFVPSDNSKRKIVLPRYLCTDQIFRDWIKTIPKVPR